MNTSALYHRTESEYAYLHSPDEMQIRLRTARSDVRKVCLIHGDPYTASFEKWYLEKTPMKKVMSTDLHDYWQINVGAKYRRLQYGFYVEGMDGTTAFYGDQGVYPYVEEFLEESNFYFRMPFFQEIDRFKAPSWVKDTVWYQIFPERFANGDPSNDPEGTLPWGSKRPSREDFFGGDLQGVIDHLDYLVDLGINGLYFCPIFKAYSNHKYDTIDYLEIDPDFGDKALFKKLVDEAHERGIRVMLDAVFNHMGDVSHEWIDVIRHGEESQYKDWFHIHSFPVDDYKMTDIPETAENLSYDTFAFTPHMPKLNTANPEVQEYLLHIASYWIKEFDIDAWRLDVANEVDHQFWKKFRQTVTELKEDFYILGEIWHSSQRWLQGDEFHAVMNYAFTDNIKEFFVEKKITASKMISGMNQQQILYRDQANEVTFNLLDSHDTARILTLCEGNKELVKSIFTFMFLQKGAPCVYYGTEIGMEGKEDPDCRRCMIWEEDEQDLDMRDFMKQLIAFRKEYADTITFGEIEWLKIDDKKQQIKLKKTYQNQQIYGYFNEGETPLSISVKGDILLSENADNKGADSYTIKEHGFVLSVY